MKDSEFINIEFMKILEKWKSPFLADIKKTFSTIKPLLNTSIPKYFSNYTLHDIDHSIRVANYMYQLVANKIKGTEKQSLIKELDIVIMLYSAFLHDIGMAVSCEEEKSIKENKHPTSDKYHYQLSNLMLLEYLKGKSEIDCIQEFVRKTHGFRSFNYIMLVKDLNFVIPNNKKLDFREDLAKVCQSHNENYEWIKSELKDYKVLGKYECNLQFCASILRLADLLDIDSERTPSSLFDSVNPEGISLSEWKQHLVIQNADKIEFKKNNQLRLRFIGTCKEPHIHRKIYHYLDWIKMELLNCKKMANNFSQNYKIDFDTEIYREIDGIGYSIPDYKMSVDYSVISSLLMGEKIYGNKKKGLRELIQNSMDACKVREEYEKKHQKIGYGRYEPKISIIINKQENQVIIKDNGMGMTHNIIKNHFLSIGKSYYKSDDFKLQAYEYIPIGEFGIGFLACFMLSNNVVIRTKYLNSNTQYEIELSQGEEYSCIKEKKINYGFEGTEIVLNYLSFFKIFKDEEELLDFIRLHFLTSEIVFELINVSDRVNYTVIKTCLSDKLTLSNHGYSMIINLSNYLNGIEGYCDLHLNSGLVYRGLKRFLLYLKRNGLRISQTKVESQQ